MTVDVGRRFTYYFRYMLGAEVDVKGHKLPHRAALRQTVAQIFNRIDGRQEVGAGRMQRYADRCIPSGRDVER